MPLRNIRRNVDAPIDVETMAGCAGWRAYRDDGEDAFVLDFIELPKCKKDKPLQLMTGFEKWLSARVPV